MLAKLLHQLIDSDVELKDFLKSINAISYLFT